MSVSTQTTSNIKSLRTWVTAAITRFVPAPLLARIVPARSAISKERWEQEYTTGHWDYLAGQEQLSRYSVIAGYCQFLRPGARVLDVGCGNGVLAKRLSRDAFTAYLGIDLSEAAVDQARGADIPNTTFAVADAETFEPPHAFDVIVFNEFLYYVKDPEAQVQRYARSLAPGGLIVVSMWYSAHGIKIWKRLQACLETCDRVRIGHGPSGKSWDVATLVLRQPQAGRD